MASNKEEAKRAMAMAEDKFKANDVEGAKKLALKAKTHFPSLPGLPQAIAAYEVHIAGKKRDPGETRWCYAVLGVDPSDSFQAIKKRYKKLCVQIHPDKNRSAAADGAFKLVKEAWDMISESYAEAPGGGASTHAAPEVPRRGTRDTRNNFSSHDGANARGGPNGSRTHGGPTDAPAGPSTTANTSHAYGGTNSSRTYGGPTDANGGPSTATDTSHACGGGNDAYGSSSTAYPAYATHGYWYWQFSNAPYGSNSYHRYYQHNYYGTYVIHQQIFWF